MRLRRKRIGFYHEGLVDPAQLPKDWHWVGVNGNPRELVYLPDKEENAVISNLIDKFQAKYPPNRLVALAMAVLATPLAALGAWLATWVPLHLPGLPAFTSGQATAFLIAVAGGGLLAAIKAGDRWLDGWQFDEARKHEAKQQDLERDHELKMAIAKSDQPHVVLSALDELANGDNFRPPQGGEPAPDSPSAAVSGVVPPPQPPPLAEVPHSPPPAAEAPPAPETLKEELDRVAPPPVSPGPPTSAPPSSPPRMTGFPPPSPAAPPPDPPGAVDDDADVIPAMPPPPPSTAPDPPIEG